MAWHSAEILMDTDDDRALGIWRRADVDPITSRPRIRAASTARKIDPAHINALKVACPKGQPYDDSNTYRRPDRRARECRACKRERRESGSD